MAETHYLRRDPKQTISFPDENGIGLIKGYAFRGIPSEAAVIYSREGTYHIQNPPSGWDENMLDNILLNPKSGTEAPARIKDASSMMALAMRELGHQFMEETRSNYLLHGETALIISPEQIYVGKPGLIISTLRKEHDTPYTDSISAFIDKYTKPEWKKAGKRQY